jgi:hypothetical protein
MPPEGGGGGGGVNTSEAIGRGGVGTALGAGECWGTTFGGAVHPAPLLDGGTGGDSTITNPHIPVGAGGVGGNGGVVNLGGAGRSSVRGGGGGGGGGGTNGVGSGAGGKGGDGFVRLIISF